MKDKKAVKLHAVDLAHEIRDFCKSQVDIWRQIPWVASDANGRDYLDLRLTRAATSGVWLVQAPMAIGQVQAYVDLLTGELIDTVLFHRNAECAPIKDMAVLPFAMALDSLDASVVLQVLRMAADKPFSEGIHPVHAREWRDHIRAYYNLNPVYDGTAKRCFD